MHGAAQPLHTTGRLAEEFGHAALRRESFGKRMPVVTVGGDPGVVRASRREGASDHGLLTDVKVAESSDLAAHLVLLRGTLLEASDQQH